MQVLYLGRALRTKKTLPDFLKWRRVTRHLLVFRGLTGSQWTPWVLGARAGQGCALVALGLFLARFDSVLFLSQIFGHCS